MTFLQRLGSVVGRKSGRRYVAGFQRDLELNSDAAERATVQGRAPRRDELAEASVIVNSLKKEQVVRGVRVSRLDDDGRGVVTVYVRRDKQLFEFAYDRALPGEKVHLRVGEAKHDRFKGKQEPGRYRLLLERGAPSPDEVSPACEHFDKDKCGGCTLQNLSYESQLLQKHGLLELRVKQFGLRGVELERPTASPSAFGFHSRTEFRCFRRDGVQLGLHPVGSPVPIAIERCHLHPAAAQSAFEATKAAIQAHQTLGPFDERTGRGCVCNVIFRSVPTGVGNESEVLVTLVTTPTAQAEPMRQLGQQIMQRCSDIVGVVWSTEGGEPAVRKPGWRSRGHIAQELLSGRSYLSMTIAGLAFQCGPEAHLRPNLLVAQDLHRRIGDVCAEIKPRTVYDVFCGQGTISFYLLAKNLCENVVAIDRSLPALSSLRQNFKQHGFSDRVNVIEADFGSIVELKRMARRMLSDADDTTAEAVKRLNDPSAPISQDAVPLPDLLVLDPGRNGLPKPFRRFVWQARVPEVIYIGGGRPILKDCALLQKYGYRVKALIPFDSHPHSPRLELMARLQWHGVPEESDKEEESDDEW